MNFSFHNLCWRGKSSNWKNADILERKECTSLNDYNNIVFSGSLVIGGSGEGIVLAVGKETVYGEISRDINIRKNGFEKEQIRLQVY